MPDIRIARYDAVSGWLPPVCPKHGRPADRVATYSFSTPTPAWAFVLLLLGVLPFLLAAESVRKTDKLRFPACADCGHARDVRRQVRWVSGMSALVLLIASMASGSIWLMVVGIAVVLVWLLTLSSISESFVSASGTLDGPWLLLKNAHPAFVAALRPNPAWQRSHVR